VRVDDSSEFRNSTKHELVNTGSISIVEAVERGRKWFRYNTDREDGMGPMRD
jgi:hypothetical protein